MLTTRSPQTATHNRARHRLPTFLLLIPLLILGVGPLGMVAAVAAPPCPDPAPPPQECGGLPCLPNTGGGYCADHPDDPTCAGGGVAPNRATSTGWALSGWFRRAASPILGAAGDIAFAAAPPCDGPAPAPTPVPLIPVCVACEAPGVASTVELPQVRVRANPDTGLVNVPTWLWAEGYRGQELFASRSWSPPYEPTTIEVRYFIRRYLWNFGDGGQIENRSLGQPYPAESDIKNAYGWSSRTEPGGVFHLSLTIEWNVEYRVNGGPPQALPPAQRRYEALYPVQELQPVITNP